MACDRHQLVDLHASANHIFVRQNSHSKPPGSLVELIVKNNRKTLTNNAGQASEDLHLAESEIAAIRYPTALTAAHLLTLRL